MKIRICPLLVFLLPAIVAASGQQIAPTGPQTIRLNVIVSPASGEPATGLRKQDFSLLDNKAPQAIASFKAVSSTQEPVKVILLIDAVNTDFDRVAYERSGVQKFLKANDGKLAHPTSIAVLTDKGTQIQKSFSNDGNALSTSLDDQTIGLRQITRSTGFWGADERVQISLTAVQQLAGYASTIPGRKIVLWISPGWPLLSGVRVDLDSKQQRHIFANVVDFSKELQQSNLTLYSINPLGPEESLFRANCYQTFLRGVSKADQTDLADLSLQVLAIQSGGLSLNGSSDVAGNIEKCLRDTESWYEITFAASVAEQRNEYHHIQITIDKRGLIARTRDGYYAEP